MVFGGGAVFAIPEGGGEIHRTLRRDARFHLHRPTSIGACLRRRRESFRNQVLNGIPLGEGHYLRLFPVWMDYRGHFGTILPQAQALMNAAHLRGDLESAALAQRQVEWIIGRNPFSQSTMYGEGYDFPPLYAPFPGNIVGALPGGHANPR